MQDKRVGTVSVRGNTYSSGVARIMIPHGSNRKTYVQECLTTGFVSIQPDLNNPIHRVRCDKSVLQTIIFPDSEDQLGSYVVYVTIPKQKRPIIVACIDSAFEYNGTLSENQFVLAKRTDFGGVSIVGDGKGQLSISVSSEASQKGLFDINISNPDNTAKLNLNVKGNANINATGNILLKSESEVNVVSPSIKHNEGSEPMVLGKTNVDLMREIFQLIASSVIMGQPLSNATQILDKIATLEDILSEKSRLD